MQSPERPGGRAAASRLIDPLMALAIGAAAAATLAVAFALLVHAHPMSDDLCNGVPLRELGVLGATRHEYLSWGGRWGSLFAAVVFLSLVDVTRAYPLGIGAIFVTQILALGFLVSSLPPLRGRTRLAWGLALLLAALYWSGMPHPGESVYWLEGAWVYSFNVSLALVVVAGLLRLPAAPSPARGAAAAGLALMAFGIAVFHELPALALLAVLSAGALVALRARDSRWRAWAAVAAAVLAGLASIVLAPGNAARQSHFQEGGNVVQALVAALRMWIRVLDAPVGRGDPLGSLMPLGWLADPRLLAATVLFVCAPSIRSLRAGWLEREPWLWRLGVPALGLGILTGSFLVGGWGLGRTLPLRAFNYLYLVFLLGWFVTAFAWMQPHAAAGGPPAGAGYLRVVCAAILALGLLVSTNVKQGVRDLATGRAASFDRAMALRYEEARRVQRDGGSELVWQPIDPWPSSYVRFDVGDISPELRECLARYFGVGSVRVAEPARQGP